VHFSANLSYENKKKSSAYFTTQGDFSPPARLCQPRLCGASQRLDARPVRRLPPAQKKAEKARFDSFPRLQAR
jgi:hypothetical protein